ncbi:MAG: UbiH/UbiF/VisC/COQ6 family ubiquinone biosynthesis hydroxylase [Parvularculaceae bacterium]|nr:UbiH/UbiF/VisC/COQ6 family ubiquinone biosynthesis hydroxylase [Parvularculaceae bacterium]
MEETFDVVVVGGGLAGALAALALARSGLKAALVDAQDPAVLKSKAYDGRTTALAYASARVFRRLGVFEAFAADAEPILDILVTDGSGPGRAPSPFFMHFDSRELESGEPLGWIVENEALRNAVYVGAESSGVALFAPARVLSAEFGEGGARALLADGRRLVAPLIVGADGRHSPLRTSAGIKVSAWEYPQTAIVATVAHDRPHKGVAHEYFLPSGPFAILPMTRNRSSLVWTERRAAAPAYLQLDDEAFRRAVADRFGDFLGDIRLEGPRWSYPLAFHLAQRFIAPRLALIGDAARAIHPIAGQGFNLGVKDVAALAEILGDAVRLGLDLGSLGVLEDYERWRRFDSLALALGTDAVNRLFSNNIAPLRLARDLGLGAVNRAGPLRRFFMRQAGGDVGRLPALMGPER